MQSLIYYQNKYAKGHEQREKRPHFVIYEGKDFFLSLPQTTRNKQHRGYPSHKNYILDDSEVMIDQLQIIPKAQVLGNNTMETGLSAGLRKVSIKLVSAHRKSLVNHFLSQAILQSKTCTSKDIRQITFGDIIKLHNKNPLLRPYNTFIVLSCAKFHLSSMCLVAPYKDESIIFELLHCIDFQKREFELLDNAKDRLDIGNLCEKIRLSLEIGEPPRELDTTSRLA
ncbi:hypothetical protein [Helicobacter bizzozeronii]|uniref:hypothetical protein n=1 Tax=Helicobacter bizzozeronii TaxID=56877 RepID=UPI000CF15B78|nr:hypothetical protein [Helicobacter bizzozeronii]